MKWSKKRFIVYGIAVVILLAVIAISFGEFEYAYMPPEDEVLQGDESVNRVSHDPFLRLGRETFYKETFGNEVFLTDIMGLLNGALTIPKMAKAILKLRGKGTTNLQVEIAKDVVIGGKSFKKGQLIDTGIDVPKGAYTPLGMPIKLSEGRIKVGISCIACHASVDRETKRVIEGAPNRDLNAGLLMALATNSYAYFTHSDVAHLSKYLGDLKRTVTTSDGKPSPLPDPEKLEQAVDANFLKWPKGNFDSTIDLVSNPSQIPDSFTKGDHPYDGAVLPRQVHFMA